MINHCSFFFFFFCNVRQHVFLSVLVDSLSFSGEFLDHSSQPGRKKESNRSQYAHQYKHPEEYPVNDHGHILPVLLYLEGKTQSREGHFKFHTTPPFFFTSCQFSPLIDFSRMADFSIMKQLSP